MSNPPHLTTTITRTQQPPPPPLQHNLHQHPQLLPSREYRKGNWTIQETLTLITAKKLNEEYRSSTRATATPGGGKLRWNWIEEYCWENGCYRSQNQCNDKWDNLLRDYKKVHRYQQSRSSPSSTLKGSDSYWKMERHERKLHSLPSNMAPEVYEAINEVVQRRCNFNNNNNNNNTPLQQQQVSGTFETPTPITIRQPSPVAVEAPPTTVVSEGVDSGDGTEEASVRTKSKLKKRRVGKVSSSIKRSGSILAQTLKSCDEMKERRHQQVMELEQRRLQIEETRNEVNRQGIADFVKAMSNLSDAIHSIISNFNDKT